MSGPKCNQDIIFDEVYIEKLENEQQEKLEEERRKYRERIERERRERLEREKAERESDEFSRVFGEIESSEREFLAAKEEFDLAYGDYCAACKLSGSVPQQLAFDADEIGRIIISLSEMTRIEEEKALENAKKRYIAESINQCMIDSGFQPLCTMGKKTKMTVYDFGDDTGLGVTSSGNKVTFEVAGLSQIQRAPDNDEKIKITAKMEDFCHVFDSLESKLMKKGIGTENVYRMPADEKYARIISIPGGKARIQTDEKVRQTISAERKRNNGK